MTVILGSIQLGYKDAAWFMANPTIVLLQGQKVHLQQTGTYKIGDGVTALSGLSFLGSYIEVQTLNAVLTLGNTTGGRDVILSNNDVIKNAGGTEFLKLNSGEARLSSATQATLYSDALVYVNAPQIYLDSPLYNFAQLSGSTVPYLDSSKNLKSSTVTPTQLGYLDATSSIQTQIDTKFATASFTDAAVTGKLLTGYVSGAGTLAATDTILQAFNKLNGNVSALTTGVSSVFGRTGAVVAVSGDYNTSLVTELTNLYYTNARVNTQVATYTGDVTLSGTAFAIGSAKVTNAMLVNSSVTINGNTVSLGGSTTVTANLTNALTVDNNSLQLDSGTTFNGSAARTISVKAIGITNAMLAGSIAYSKLILTGSVVNTDIVSLAWSKITSTPTTLAGYGITDAQPLATNLTSLTGLTYVSTSFVKMTAAGTFTLDTNTYLTTASASASYQPLDSDLTIIAGLTATTDNFIVSVSSAWASRTPSQVKTTLSLNNVENTALSTWAGSSNLVTLGTITSGLIGPAYGGTGIANNAASTWTISGNFATTVTVSATTTITLPTSGTLYGTKAGSITSAQMLASMSDPTGTGLSVFATSPTFTTQITTPIIYGSSASGGTLLIDSTSNATKGALTFGTAGGGNNYLFNTGTGTALFTIMGKVGSTTQAAIYLGVASGSETASNYVLNWSGALNLNAQATTSTINILHGGTSSLVITPGGTVSNAFYDFNTRARAGLTTLTNVPVFNLGSQTQTWAAGTVPLQYFAWLKTQTMAFASASTTTFVSSLTVDYSTRGTNATFGTTTAIYIPTLAYTSTTTSAGIIIDQASGAGSNFTSIQRFDASNFFTTGLNSTGNVTFALTGTTPLFAFSNGIILPAGTATALTYPLKFTSGTNLTTAVAGVMEYNGTNLFFTRTGTTRQTVLTANVVTTEVVVNDTTININVNGTDYKILAKA